MSIYLILYDITTHDITTHDNAFLSVFTFGKGLGTRLHKCELKLQLPPSV